MLDGDYEAWVRSEAVSASRSRGCEAAEGESVRLGVYAAAFKCLHARSLTVELALC